MGAKANRSERLWMRERDEAGTGCWNIGDVQVLLVDSGISSKTDIFMHLKEVGVVPRRGWDECCARGTAGDWKETRNLCRLEQVYWWY